MYVSIAHSHISLSLTPLSTQLSSSLFPLLPDTDPTITTISGGHVTGQFHRREPPNLLPVSDLSHPSSPSLSAFPFPACRRRCSTYPSPPCSVAGDFPSLVRVVCEHRKPTGKPFPPASFPIIVTCLHHGRD